MHLERAEGQRGDNRRKPEGRHLELPSGEHLVYASPPLRFYASSVEHRTSNVTAARSAQWNAELQVPVHSGTRTPSASHHLLRRSITGVGLERIDCRQH